MQKNTSVIISQGLEQVNLNYDSLRKAVLALRAVNHRLRQEMIEFLQEREQTTVTDIYVKLRIEQSVASQHLAILRRAEIVDTTRDGKFIYYSLNDDKLMIITKLVSQLG
ncbi:MAG: DNA-binding transcriptional ArsR family regulator [Saprospiraceae bacterium]|jgi:DNA-binding transcriptional ArsR family regulator|tara:strand:+ start:122 stop:451 length:330 start_codon:yes stop_codon:yes gene_type:complete